MFLGSVEKVYLRNFDLIELFSDQWYSALYFPSKSKSVIIKHPASFLSNYKLTCWKFFKKQRSLVWEIGRVVLLWMRVEGLLSRNCTNDNHTLFEDLMGWFLRICQVIYSYGQALHISKGLQYIFFSDRFFFQ